MCIYCQYYNKIQTGNVWLLKQLREIVQNIIMVFKCLLAILKICVTNLPFYFTRCVKAKRCHIVCDLKNTKKCHKYQGEKHFSDFKIGTRVRNWRKKSYDKSWNLFNVLRNRNTQILDIIKHKSPKPHRKCPTFVIKMNEKLRNRLASRFVSVLLKVALKRQSGALGLRFIKGAPKSATILALFT